KAAMDTIAAIGNGVALLNRRFAGTPLTEHSRSLHASFAPQVAGTEPLCVHFAHGGDDYCLTVGADEKGTAALPELAVSWRRRPSGVLWGEVMLRRSPLCDAVLLHDSGRGYRHDRDVLRQEGLPRTRAAILARLPQRPLLASFARGPQLPRHTLGQIHGLLLSAAAACREAI